MKKALIAHENRDFSKKIVKQLQGICAVGICEEAASLEGLLTGDCWDVLVLDMLLPGCDGLRQIALANLVQRTCRILAISPLLSGYLCDALGEKHIPYLMVWPCSPGMVAGRVRDLLGVDDAVMPETAARNLLHSLGIPSRMLGYRYLREALMLMAAEGGMQPGSGLYTRIGNRWGSSASQVEKSMRSAIGEAWRRRQEPVWRLYFPPVAGQVQKKPALSEFLACVGSMMPEKGGSSL